MTSSGCESQLKVMKTLWKGKPDLDTELSVEGEKTSPENRTRPEARKLRHKSNHRNRVFTITLAIRPLRPLITYTMQ